MTKAAPFAEIWRGPFLESVHSGHAVICDASGQIVEAWGDPEKIILPRSSSKMIQALPLINSGAEGDGWLVRMKIDDVAQLENLMDADAYKASVA